MDEDFGRDLLSWDKGLSPSHIADSDPELVGLAAETLVDFARLRRDTVDHVTAFDCVVWVDDGCEEVLDITVCRAVQRRREVQAFAIDLVAGETGDEDRFSCFWVSLEFFIGVIILLDTFISGEFFLVSLPMSGPSEDRSIFTLRVEAGDSLRVLDPKQAVRNELLL